MPFKGVSSQVSKVYKWTSALVGSLVALGGALVAFWLLPLEWFILSALLGAYEFWTLVNKESQDTISEAVWEYSKRPVFVGSLCLGLGYMAGSGYMGVPHEIIRALLIGVLAGHFFFTKYRSR